MKVGPRWHWKPCGAPVPIDPHGHARPALDRPGRIDEMSVVRDRKRRHTGVGAHEYTVGHGKRRPPNFEPIDIEGHGEKLSVTRIHHVAGRRVSGARATLDQNLLFTGLE